MEEEIHIIQNTWMEVLKKDPIRIGQLFFDRLFEQAPSMKAFFSDDMALHSKRFITKMSFIIVKFSEANFIQEVKAIGKRHAELGFRDEHYEYIKEALFLVLRQQLGDRWTPKTMTTWIWGFSTISRIMKEASRQAM